MREKKIFNISFPVKPWSLTI